MERAPLRPVPSRPPGPVDPDEAVSHVRARLPVLDEAAVAALALVDLASRPRAEVAGDALARGRKALRRSLYPLPGSGWCERAERMISDRIDGVLAAPGPARLDAHLRNCARCVEHELRLAQATDALVRSFVETLPEPEPEPEPEPAGEAPPPPELRIVTPVEPEPAAGPAGPAPEPGRSVDSWAWLALFGIAVLLTVLAVALAVLGALGGSL